MPQPPQGVGTGFWDRLKQRITEELGGPTRPDSPGVAPAPGEPPADEQLEPGLMDRLKTRLKNLVAPKSKPMEPPPGLPRILYRIRQAGRSGTLLFMKYHNTWRHVEPYSFRYKGRGRSLRFFGYCRLHGHIEMYIPEKIEDAVVTDERFAPRWTVELN